MDSCLKVGNVLSVCLEKKTTKKGEVASVVDEYAKATGLAVLTKAPETTLFGFLGLNQNGSLVFVEQLPK